MTLLVAHAARSGQAQLVGVDQHPGATTHDVHQEPDALIGGDLFDLGHKVSERSRGQADLVARLQTPWRQQHPGRVAAQEQLADDAQRHGGRHLAKADQAGDAEGGIDRAPVADRGVEGHKDIAREQRTKCGDEVVLYPPGGFLPGQEVQEALTCQVTLGDMVAIGLQLCQEPGRVAVMVSQFGRSVQL